MNDESWQAVYENLYQASRFTRMADEIIDGRISRQEPLTHEELATIKVNLESASAHRQAAIEVLW